MTEKLFSLEVDEIKDLERQIAKLAEDRDAKAAKAEQLNAEVFALRERRDELENIQKNASLRLLDGSLSEAEFCANKQELAALYQGIDDKDELFNLFDRAANDDYAKQYGSLINLLNSKRTKLLSKYATQITYDLVEQCELQFKQLLATLPSVAMRPENLRGLDLGDALIVALSHEKDGSRKPVDSGESKRLIADILNELGLAPWTN